MCTCVSVEGFVHILQLYAHYYNYILLQIYTRGERLPGIRRLCAHTCNYAFPKRIHGVKDTLESRLRAYHDICAFANTRIVSTIILLIIQLL
jgi:hypothetical protein